jgi:hypothetical protein
MIQRNTARHRHPLALFSQAPLRPDDDGLLSFLPGKTARTEARRAARSVTRHIRHPDASAPGFPFLCFFCVSCGETTSVAAEVTRAETRRRREKANQPFAPTLRPGVSARDDLSSFLNLPPPVPPTRCSPQDTHAAPDVSTLNRPPPAPVRWYPQCDKRPLPQGSTPAQPRPAPGAGTRVTSGPDAKSTTTAFPLRAKA